MEQYSYYVKVNEENIVIEMFSDAMRQPDENSLFLEKGNERFLMYNLLDDNFIYKYKLNNYENGVATIIERSDNDKLSELNQTKWQEIRQIRNDKLSKCDWIFLNDSKYKDNENWKTYRQSLRDLPQNQTDPFNIIWPNKP
jgi:hypothetical protein